MTMCQYWVMSVCHKLVTNLVMKIDCGSLFKQTEYFIWCALCTAYSMLCTNVYSLVRWGNNLLDVHWSELHWRSQESIWENGWLKYGSISSYLGGPLLSVCTVTPAAKLVLWWRFCCCSLTLSDAKNVCDWPDTGRIYISASVTVWCLYMWLYIPLDNLFHTGHVKLKIFHNGG